jgi:DNA polymerase-3 subunit alpha
MVFNMSSNVGSYTELHLHSEYSIIRGRDGLSKIEDIAPKAKSLGMDTVALTDHGLMSGCPKFVKSCNSAGIKYILGMEAYLAPGDHKEKDGDTSSSHFLVLARNEQGYRNLCRLSSLSYTEGFYKKPRVSLALLDQYKEGLTFTSACIAGPIFKAWKADHPAYSPEEHALLKLNQLHEILGDELFLEVQKNGIPVQEEYNNLILNLAQETGLPLVITNDVHYLDKEDFRDHFKLSCIAKGSTINNPSYPMQDTGAYLKSPQEVYDSLGTLPIECMTNTVAIAARCEQGYFEKLKLPAPVFPGIDQDPHEYLTNLAGWGLWDKFNTRGEQVPQEYLDRLKYELEVIKATGYSNYFLVVWDIVTNARNCGTQVGPGRGSGAGSLVSWVLGITQLDPIRYGLHFDRFLNRERASAPDFDIDYDPKKLDSILSYIRGLYGETNVVKIGGYDHFFGKRAMRSLARVHSLSIAEGNILAGNIPEPVYGLNRPLRDHVKDNPKLNSHAPDLMSSALSIDGHIVGAKVHPCGYVISPIDISDVIPLHRPKVEEPICTQYDHEDVERLGGLKFDFLVLDNLTIIDHALQLIKSTTGLSINIDKVSLEDDDVWDTISEGNLVGLFQLETSPQMKSAIMSTRPRAIEQLADLVALYRPGPIEAGYFKSYVDAKITNVLPSLIHPALKSVLTETLNVPVYQEQMMSMAKELAGYSLAQADILRKAIGKKKPEEMALHETKFKSGLINLSGFTVGAADKLWKELEGWSSYGFPKAHAVSYAVFAYKTAYLKTHYPVPYMCALLATRIDKAEKLNPGLAECRRLGIRLHGADVNHSQIEFTLANGEIYFGLAALNGLGPKAAQTIIRSRGTKPFISLEDFMSRVNTTIVNKSVLRTLVSAGAFDSLGYQRQNLLDNANDVSDYFMALRSYEEKLAAYNLREQEVNDYITMFGDVGKKISGKTKPRRLKEPEKPAMPLVETCTKQKITLGLLGIEHETTGVYITANPGDFIESEGDESSVSDLIDLPEDSFRDMIVILSTLEPEWNKGWSVMLRAQDRYGEPILVFIAKAKFDKLVSTVKDSGLIILDSKISVMNSTMLPPKVKIVEYEVLYS